jgi:DNA-directed RNA polymerase specialized sigma24 family protein
MRIEIFRETSGVAVSTALKKRAVRSESNRMSHAKRRSPPEPEAIAATPDQIREAYLALTKTELARLASFARWRFQALGRRRQARDPDELVTDAFLAILDGTRTWYPAKAAFFVALIGAIRSQTYNMRTKAAKDAFDDLNSIVDPADPEADPFEDFEAPTGGDSGDLEKLIKERFAKDTEAALVLEARLDGNDPSEIRESLGLSQKEYETTVKRIRRAVKRLLEGQS